MTTNVTLTANQIDFLLKWAGVGIEAADADPDISDAFHDVSTEVEAQLDRVVETDQAARRGAEGEPAGFWVINPAWHDLVLLYADHEEMTYRQAEQTLSHVRDTDSRTFESICRAMDVEVPQ